MPFKKEDLNKYPKLYSLFAENEDYEKMLKITDLEFRNSLDN